MITHVSTVLNYLASVAGTRVNKNGDAVREGERRAREERQLSPLACSSLSRAMFRMHAPATQALTSHYIGLPTCDLLLAKRIL